MSEFILITTIVIVVLSTVASFFLIDSYDKTDKKSIKSIFNPDDYIMDEVFSGKIKCNIITNTSSPYDVDKWTGQIKQFIKRPIFKQLMSLEGNENNGKY